MIDSEYLASKTNYYLEQCQEHNKAPTYYGYGTCLGISGNTIRHIVNGHYKNGKPYTDTPHITRCIDNNDFNIIKSVFI